MRMTPKETGTQDNSPMILLRRTFLKKLGPKREQTLDIISAAGDFRSRFRQILMMFTCFGS